MRLLHENVNLHCDNQSALHLTMNQMMKHIELRCHSQLYINVFDKMFELVNIDDKFKLIDIFTKVISLGEIFQI